MFGLGLLCWVRESVLSSKAPHREKVKFVLDGDEDGKGKGKKGNACLNLGVTKREDSVKMVAFFFSFLLFFFWSIFFFFFWSSSFPRWNVVFQPEFGRGGGYSLFRLFFDGMANNNMEANQEEDECQEPKSVLVKRSQDRRRDGGELLGWEVGNMRVRSKVVRGDG